jgi:hypothetical protein
MIQASQACIRRNATVQGTCARSNIVAKAAATEVPVLKGPTLQKKYHGPHAVAEEGIERIADMLRKGDLFRYGGNDEGSLQVRSLT